MTGIELPIHTERLTLRAFTPDDFDAYHAYVSRTDTTRYLYWGPLSAEETRERLAAKCGRLALKEEGDSVNPAVVLWETGELLGDVQLHWVSAEHRQGEVGYVFNPAYAGRGYATEASREMLRFAFESAGLHRVVGRLDARNRASEAVLAKLGMRREALLLEDEFLDGAWASQLIYAMLDREWTERNPHPAP